eukprot:6490909-Amphidinium_carterae.2
MHASSMNSNTRVNQDGQARSTFETQIDPHACLHVMCSACVPLGSFVSDSALACRALTRLRKLQAKEAKIHSLLQASLTMCAYCHRRASPPQQQEAKAGGERASDRRATRHSWNCWTFSPVPIALPSSFTHGCILQNWGRLRVQVTKRLLVQKKPRRDQTTVSLAF